MIQDPINVDKDGNSYTLNTRYNSIGTGSVRGGDHFPMTVISVREENTPPTGKFRY
jgi:hypothetical protein